MIQAHVFRKGEEVRDVPVAELSQVRAEPRTLVWVDLISPTPEELAAMGEEFQIHELALASCAVGSKQRPRVEEFEDQVLLIAYASKPVAEGEPVDLRELDVIAGQNFLLTFHGGAPIDAAAVAGRITARPELAKHGAGFLLYVVLDELVDTFFPTLDRIGERIEDLEETVFEATAGDTQSQIFAIRRDLIHPPGRRPDARRHGRAAPPRPPPVHPRVPALPAGHLRPHDPDRGERRGLPGPGRRGPGGQPGGRLQPIGTVARNLGAYAAIVVSAGALWVYFKRKGWL
jgi:magnesium transporter